MATIATEENVDDALEENVDEEELQSIAAEEELRTAKPAIRLVTDEYYLNLSINAVRFAVFADQATATILDPNYAFMALPGAHRDSFDSTSPFGFSAATYFLAMTGLLGAAISASIIGSISDRIGRKPCIVGCLAVGAVGAICNFIARKSFWGFCASNFAQGLFAGSVPVAIAYVSDVKPTRKQKDEEIGILVAIAMLGTSGGGICAILMESQGLFAPLFIGAALNVAATIFAAVLIIEPRKMLFVGASGRVDKDVEEEEEEGQGGPTKINHTLLWTIVSGALFDNIGSAGLLPIAMSPLAFNEFYVTFLEQGLDPIMSPTAFKWISVMVALTVIPGAGLSQVVFDKIGAAGGCIVGNVVTGIVIIILLYVASAEPATDSTFAGFIVAFYVGFPFTVLSQLSTGPMLDMISPADRRGYVQGLNIAVMNFATAISPYLLGEMADKVGVRETMWTCVGVSMAAGLINFPLTFVKALKRPKKKPPRWARALKWEDADIVEHAMQGKWVPAKDLDRLNDERMTKGEPFLVIPYKTFEEDKQNLPEIRQQAHGDFLFLRNRMVEILNDPELEAVEKREEFAAQLTHSRPPVEQREMLAAGLSKWFVDYLISSGYFVEDSPIMYKQMIMTAFPPINEDDSITAENIEQIGVNYTRVLNKYLGDKDLSGATLAFAQSVVS